MKRFDLWIALFCLLFGLSACLKTRAQLKEEASDEGSKPISVRPAQTVEPQGGYVLEEVKAELTRIEGRVEDLERFQKEMANKPKSADRDELNKLATRLQAIEESQALLTENFKKLQETPVQIDPVELYNKAISQFKDGDFEEASSTFAEYLKIPKVKKLEDALFLKGECFYKLKYYKKAIVEYSKFPEKYPHSPHLPGALYKIGLCFDALGMKEDALGFYQELVEKFPKSPEAKKIKKKVK